MTELALVNSKKAVQGARLLLLSYLLISYTSVEEDAVVRKLFVYFFHAPESSALPYQRPPPPTALAHEADPIYLLLSFGLREDIIWLLERTFA